jgi:hypothetical protein
MFPLDGAAYAPRPFSMAKRRNPNVIKAGRGDTALFFIVICNGSLLPTDGGNVMGASCLYFSCYLQACEPNVRHLLSSTLDVCDGSPSYRALAFA